MSFFIYLIALIAAQMFLEYLLGSVLGLSFIWVNIIIDLFLSIVFTTLNFRGREKLKNPDFHKSIAMYFLILTVMTVLFNYVL